LEVVARYNLDTEDPLMAAHLYLMEHLGHMKAPPRYERAINLQETETVFCKWKSHLVGRYDVGRDTERARKQFMKYSSCNLSMHLLERMPGGNHD
jgi:hypothetical protein